HGVKDWHARGRTNVIGALIGKTLLTISLFIASINADIFYAWITQDLLPKLLPLPMPGIHLNTCRLIPRT
ncbi:hypothetical protein SAMN05428978_10121, partial [Nitrosomonas sp. Nm34]